MPLKCIASRRSESGANQPKRNIRGRMEDQRNMADAASGLPVRPVRFVAITGGPGSGKTSLIEYLGSLGYATVPEAAIQIIAELNRQHGIPGQIAFRREHPVEFLHLIMRRQAALEAACAAAEGSLVFCDRGRPDALAYAELYGLPPEDELRSHAASQQYHRVFLLDTLSHFPERPHTGRTSDRSRSLQVRDLLDAAYRSQGYSPFRLPELSTADRARLVLSELGETAQGPDPR